MSRLRKFIGLWIALIVFGVVFPDAFILAFTGLDNLFGFEVVVANPYLVMTSGFVIAFGLFWVAWGYSYLHFVGKGSPIEAFGRALYPTQRLVVTGPYAFTRNPMLFGYMFILFAIALAMNSISGLVLVPLLVGLGLIYLRRFEEPVLHRRFGKHYDKYRKSVPMLIPKLKSYGGYSEV